MNLKKNLVFALLLLCLTSLTVIQGVKAQSSSNIYINPDGSVSGTTSMQRNGDLYTLTAKIYDLPLVITCNNIVVDDGFSFREQAAGVPQE